MYNNNDTVLKIKKVCIVCVSRFTLIVSLLRYVLVDIIKLNVMIPTACSCSKSINFATKKLNMKPKYGMMSKYCVYMYIMVIENLYQ